MTGHLVSRPIPIPGESSASLLMRAVEGNGYPSLSALIWAFWGNKSGKGWAEAAHTDPARYAEILSAFGIKVPEVDSICFRREGPTSESARVMDGMCIHEQMFREDGRYYCPKCLEQRPYWRRSWSLRAYSVCTEHNMYLLRDCPTCGSELSAGRGELAKCSCGTNLKQAASDPADSSAVDWWLQIHQSSLELSQHADILYLALSGMDGGEKDPISEHRRLCTVRSWIENGEVDAAVMEMVGKESALHPRLLLLPLLRRADIPEIERFAKAILKLWQSPDNMPEFKGEEVIGRRDAELALGISTAQFRKFLETTLLDFPNGERPSRGRVSQAAVNRLLFILNLGKVDAADGVTREQTKSLASMVMSVLCGDLESAGYDVTAGLNTLRLKQKAQDRQLETGASFDWVDTSQVAEVLGTYPEAVRFLRIKGWIAFRDRDLEGKKRFIANRHDVEQFHKAYVLGGTIASQLGMNPTNLSEKLMALGVQPVAGPKLDGLLVYLFRRVDIEGIDIESLRTMEQYPTNAGRKRKNGEAADGQSPNGEMNAGAAAVALGVGLSDIHSLIQKGFIERVPKLNREIIVSAKSVRRLERQLQREDLLPIDEAANRLGLTKEMLESRWIKSGVLHALDFGICRKIAAKELEYLESILGEHVTAAEGGRLLKMHRSYLPNLERRGAILSKKVGTGQGVRLYARADVINLKRGFLKPANL